MKDISTQKYHIIARVFHWVGALLILVAYLLADDYVGLHKAVGASFLLWTLLRIIGRLVTATPKPVPAPAWQTALAHLTHLGLYVLMLAQPISGILMSMYGGRAVDVFGIVQIPVMVSPDRAMAKLMNEWHTDIIFPAMLALIVAHIAAALYHQFIVKDNLIARMK
ncbi:cytochrome b [Moraxella nasovis]|uniref:cytochrome b n=1 Tax=Moraxella nasovis TaxID=2904121 RepID=UPI001F6141BB|nr:cytochrome b [Moraxella nasovis]UNU72762.1 cytochrome b [Moraxella nasovis]